MLTCRTTSANRNWKELGEGLQVATIDDNIVSLYTEGERVSAIWCLPERTISSPICRA